jgi:hypothetical protein
VYLVAAILLIRLLELPIIRLSGPPAPQTVSTNHRSLHGLAITLWY